MAQRSHDPTDRPQAAPVGGHDEIPVEDTHASSTPVPTDGAVETTRTHEQDALPDSSGGLLGSAWVGLVLGALVTILLLIFIAQNTASTDVRYLGLQFSLPLGVLILFAAIAGALIMALFAGFRILQLRMRARKARKLTTRY
ncbi:lipopolysaccharide assembly LapA domain-containing protein [Dietzia sp. B32]|uniref:LapA family protein n=1 Tax=Dietzia sp. B32 TaxID=2915130 RepID=UPI0021AD8989|nr:lipopolysaccharide assembly protein LapA domain-containing protein [Dietzia sp. B32]UVE95634.1 lipopolysaccharide assembly protein LapA domain-containing protein [Dietzia sp. B32]